MAKLWPFIQSLGDYNYIWMVDLWFQVYRLLLLMTSFEWEFYGE